MIIKNVDITKFRAFNSVAFSLGKRITAISGRNATQKTTLLGLIGQPFTISRSHPMYGVKTVDGYNFRSQFKEKFKLSEEHDIIGEHKWELELHNNVHTKDYYKIESIARKQKGAKATLRFWNAESRSRGAGYIQLPVYFLSLSRLFPIGESGKTKTIDFNLTEEELKYCINSYKTILSIQNTSEATVGIEKGSSSRVFAGISDETHDIFTNSAGEGNVTRIILAILSFRRLKEKYKTDYKGGILLIDELDATLYGFSQTKLVEYLWESADKYKIQIIFTTHSPIILERVHKYQREERYKKGTGLPPYAYDCSIVYLIPNYDDSGNRTIQIKNVNTKTELNECLCDINLSVSNLEGKLKIYCEDSRAVSFLKYVLQTNLEINIDQYMSFVDIDLGWTNYVQLLDKKVPEFTNNIIVLDGDVPDNPEYLKPKQHSKKDVVEKAENVLFLPLVIEQDLFALLKNYGAFSRFQKTSSNESFSYDICFNHWPLQKTEYKTKDFKNWFSQAEESLGGEKVLFEFWCKENQKEVREFVQNFVSIFNKFAEKIGADMIPQSHEEDESHQVNI